MIGKWRQQTDGPGSASEMVFLPDRILKGHTWSPEHKFYGDWLVCWYVVENRLVFEGSRWDKTMRSAGVRLPVVSDRELVWEGADQFTLINKIPQSPSRGTPRPSTETWIRIIETDPRHSE